MMLIIIFIPNSKYVFDNTYKNSFVKRRRHRIRATITQLKIIGVEPMIYRRSWRIEAMMGVR